MGFGKSFSMAYKLLAYLYNLKGEEPRIGIRLSKLLKSFTDLGFNDDEIKHLVIKLSQDQNYNDSTPIWLESRVGALVDDNARVSLMPSGRYFLEKLSVSREYAFWNILLTEFSEEEFSDLFRHEPLSYEQTLNDSFKLEIIYRFVQKKLLDNTSSEIAAILQNLRVPENWRGTNLEYYKSMFVVRDELYITTLLTSVQNSIPHANLPNESKLKYHEKYQDLLRESKKITSKNERLPINL
jgi:hypothetical protein